jgi:hypothetical protein
MINNQSSISKDLLHIDKNLFLSCLVDFCRKIHVKIRNGKELLIIAMIHRYMLLGGKVNQLMIYLNIQQNLF